MVNVLFKRDFFFGSRRLWESLARTSSLYPQSVECGSSLKTDVNFNCVAATDVIIGDDDDDDALSGMDESCPATCPRAEQKSGFFLAKFDHFASYACVTSSKQLSLFTQTILLHVKLMGAVYYV